MASLRKRLKKKTLKADDPLLEFYEKYSTTDVVLGEGSFAVVKRGINKQTQENVAIKIVEKDGMSDMERKGVKREIDILSSIEHRNIVRMFDWYETDTQYFIVMEYVGGGMLYDRITNSSTSFSEEDVRDIIRTLSSALKHCYKLGVVHRDIKPKNILYNTDETTLKIVDFNLSTKLTPEKIRELEMQTRCGTPHYVAPEVVAGKKYSYKCDIWSLGCIAFVVASGGYQPFSSSEVSSESEITDVLNQVEMGAWSFQPAHAWDDVSSELKDLITGMLTLNPDKRFTYDQILQHPWMKKATLAGHEINLTKLQKEIKDRLKNTAKIVTAATTFGDFMGPAEASMANLEPPDLGASGDI